MDWFGDYCFAMPYLCNEFNGPQFGIAIFGSFNMVLYRAKINAFMPEGLWEELKTEFSEISTSI